MFLFANHYSGIIFRMAINPALMSLRHGCAAKKVRRRQLI